MNMRRIIVVAALIGLAGLPIPCRAERVVLTLKPDDVRQEIDGFGASGAWWAQIVGRWQESKREEIIGLLSARIDLLEKKALEKAHLKPTYRLLQTIPGIGPILGLTILFESGDIHRFRRAGNYSSYCRAVKAQRLSNGKSKGQNNRRNGNRYLAWAFVQAAHQALQSCRPARRFYDRKKAQCNGALATKALASKWSKAAYYVMKHQQAFDLRKVFG